MADLNVSIAASADDSNLFRFDSVYPPVATQGGNQSTDLWLDVTKDFSTPTYSTRIMFMRFDTSAIPDDATVTAATLRIHVGSFSNANSRNINFEWYAWSGTLAQPGDWADVVGTTAASIAVSSLSAPALNDIALSSAAANINKTGFTGIRFGHSGAAPTGLNEVFFTAFDHASDPAPELRIVYTEAAAAALGYQRLYGPTHLGTSAADLYTVPAGRRTRIRHIFVNNPTGPAVDFTLSVGNDAAATRLYDSYNIPAEGSLEWAYDHALAAGEKIQAYAGLGSQLVLEIDGYVEEV